MDKELPTKVRTGWVSPLLSTRFSGLQQVDNLDAGTDTGVDLEVYIDTGVDIEVCTESRVDLEVCTILISNTIILISIII